MIPAATYLKHPLFQSRDRLDFLLTLPAPHDRARNQRSGLGHISQSLSLCRLLEPSRKAPFVPVALSLCYSGRSQSPRPQSGTQSLVSILGLAPNLTKSYSARLRLRYVHDNPVRHELTRLAQNYPWCSAGRFPRKASAAFRKTILSFSCDKLRVPDDFDVSTDQIGA
jgi:hypothetical protein